MITIFPCGSRRSKGVPSGTGVFLRLLVGELGTPKFAQIFAYGKWLYPHKMLVHGTSDLEQRCLKTRNSEDGCISHQISSPLPLKLPQSPNLRDLSMQNLLYRELSVSHTLMEIRSWNFTVQSNPLNVTMLKSQTALCHINFFPRPVSIGINCDTFRLLSLLLVSHIN